MVISSKCSLCSKKGVYVLRADRKMTITSGVSGGKVSSRSRRNDVYNRADRVSSADNECFMSSKIKNKTTIICNDCFDSLQ